MEKEARVSRREFLKTAAAVGAGAMSVGALSACTSEPATAASGSGITWDQEADIVIIGYGGAGVSAAIQARTAGASVLVLEKDPVARGGNTGCTGIFCIGENVESGFEYFKSLCWGTTPDDVLRAHVEAMHELPEWIMDLGGRPNYMTLVGAVYPNVPGGDKFEGPNAEFILVEKTSDIKYTWSFFADAAKERGVSVEDGTVLLSTPATKLIQDLTTKEIIGVRALSGVITNADFTYSGGTEINVKAKKGVILACGGYENNPEMLRNFAPHPHGSFVTFYGTPFNTGDGLKMAQDVGAALWHMNKKEVHALACAEASKEVGVGVVVEAYGSKISASSILVNRDGERFMNESFFTGHTDRHQAWDEFTHLLQPDDSTTYSDYRNVPFYWIFDQTLMDHESLLAKVRGEAFRFAPVNGLVTWSEDNQAEVAKGWILKGDTLEELGEKLVAKDYFGRTVGVDPTALAETVRSYNAYAAAGNDPDFGRAGNTMIPLDNGPFYAMELVECQTNTDGGPVRNKYCQVLDTADQPIPRLYCTGELGSIWGFLYNGGGNIPEAYASGRMAVDHALTLEPLA
jgi:succinate dehydrogenase/fumarate reductase flavoprotein subunit